MRLHVQRRDVSCSLRRNDKGIWMGASLLIRTSQCLFSKLEMQPCVRQGCEIVLDAANSLSQKP